MRRSERLMNKARPLTEIWSKEPESHPEEITSAIPWNKDTRILDERILICQCLHIDDHSYHSSLGAPIFIQLFLFGAEAVNFFHQFRFFPFDRIKSIDTMITKEENNNQDKSSKQKELREYVLCRWRGNKAAG